MGIGGADAIDAGERRDEHEERRLGKVKVGDEVIDDAEVEARPRADEEVGVAGAGDTDLFIRPGTGFDFRVVDHLVTNFHLPESTLLMLVSAFAGVDRIRAAYAHAVAAGYRFFSYGDAMLLTRPSRC